MRRTVTTLAVTMLAVSTTVVPGIAADLHDEAHAHLFVQRPTVEYLEEGPQGPGVYATGFRRCVDMPVVAAHHHSLHTGSAGDALRGKAGHMVAPAAPLSPWEDCAALEAALPIRLP